MSGVVATGLGILGLFLPILPTTPFLLLAAACFVRSSSRLHRWLVTNAWFGDYIRQYQTYRAIPLRVKVSSITLLWLTMGYSVICVVDAWWLRALLTSIAAGVTVHLLRLKTLTPKLLSELEEAERIQPSPSSTTASSSG